jgi:murein DD-endopeptidase MepM/ murein hydrolase activator NlpD
MTKPILILLALVPATAGFLAAAGTASDGTTTVSTSTATETTTAAPATPCVGAGVLAVAAPNVPGGPVTDGPAVVAADSASINASSFADPGYGLTVSHVAVGGAGCAAPGIPGGTSVRVGAWSLFGGAVKGVSLRADLVPATDGGTRWRLRFAVAGLTVNGLPATLAQGDTMLVGDWGELTREVHLDPLAPPPLRWWAGGLGLRLLKPRGGLPKGSLLLVGFAAADRAPAPLPSTAPPPVTTTAPATTTAPTAPPATTVQASTAETTTATPPRKPKPRPKAALHRGRPGEPLTARPPLGGVDYVFPVDGGTAWGDNYGTLRTDVPGSWHHGDDLFAPLGTPVVAVTEGTIYAVGWNKVGGWRLWLTDDRGNSFYYAHLSGYTANAQNDTRVRRGEVLGFIGNTGDAHTAIPHLHFEVHPGGLLYLGYDGAVDPTSYLAGWPRVGNEHVPAPAPLPVGPRQGAGILANFRKLLALHPRPAAKAQRHGVTRTSTAPRSKRPHAERVAAAPASAAPGRSIPRGVLLALALAVLGAAGLGAVALSVRRE